VGGLSSLSLAPALNASCRVGDSNYRRALKYTNDRLRTRCAAVRQDAWVRLSRMAYLWMRPAFLSGGATGQAAWRSRRAPVSKLALKPVASTGSADSASGYPYCSNFSHRRPGYTNIYPRRFRGRASQRWVAGRAYASIRVVPFLERAMDVIRRGASCSSFSSAKPGADALFLLGTSGGARCRALRVPSPSWCRSCRPLGAAARAWPSRTGLAISVLLRSVRMWWPTPPRRLTSDRYQDLGPLVQPRLAGRVVFSSDRHRLLRGPQAAQSVQLDVATGQWTTLTTQLTGRMTRLVVPRNGPHLLRRANRGRIVQSIVSIRSAASSLDEQPECASIIMGGSARRPRFLGGLSPSSLSTSYFARPPFDRPTRLRPRRGPPPAAGRWWSSPTRITRAEDAAPYRRVHRDSPPRRGGPGHRHRAGRRVPVQRLLSDHQLLHPLSRRSRATAPASRVDNFNGTVFYLNQRRASTGARCLPLRGCSTQRLHHLFSARRRLGLSSICANR